MEFYISNEVYDFDMEDLTWNTLPLRLVGNLYGKYLGYFLFMWRGGRVVEIFIHSYSILSPGDNARVMDMSILMMPTQRRPEVVVPYLAWAVNGIWLVGEFVVISS